MKKLFLDDIREVELIYGAELAAEFDVVRSYKEFVAYIKKNGLPDFISFDNDLGLDERGGIAPDGYAAAKWLVYESGAGPEEPEIQSSFCQPGGSGPN